MYEYLKKQFAPLIWGLKMTGMGIASVLLITGTYLAVTTVGFVIVDLAMTAMSKHNWWPEWLKLVAVTCLLLAFYVRAFSVLGQRYSDYQKRKEIEKKLDKVMDDTDKQINDLCKKIGIPSPFAQGTSKATDKATPGSKVTPIMKVMKGNKDVEKQLAKNGYVKVPQDTDFHQEITKVMEKHFGECLDTEMTITKIDPNKPDKDKLQ